MSASTTTAGAPGTGGRAGEPELPSTPLGTALAELEHALDVGGDALDPAAAASGRQVLDRARGRLASDPGASVVALAGATGSGKSSLFNAVAGLTVATVGVRRPTTSHPTACVWGDVPDELLDWLEVPRRHRTERVSELDADTEAVLEGLVLLDLPDYDSTTVSNRLQVDRLVELADLVIWVADPQKYADAALHDGYLRHLADHQDVVLVVLNQVDTLDEASAAVCEADLRRLLAADGLDRVRLLTTSARTGQGVGALRRVLTDLVQARSAARRRSEADVAAALRLLDGQDDGGPVVLVGHSAGGHLALVHSGAADAVVALAPVTDLVRGHAEGIGRGAVAELMGVPPGEGPEAYALASPRLRPWPACPVLVVHGTDDARVPVEHSRDYADAAGADGAPVELVEPPSLDHMALIDPAAPHWPAVHAWLDQHLRVGAVRS